MHNSWVLVLLAIFGTVFAFFVAEELNIRRLNPSAATSWTPAFFPLLALALFVIGLSAGSLVLNYRRLKKPLRAQNDDGEDEERKALRVASADAGVDLIIALLAIFFIVAVISALNRADSEVLVHPWATFAAVEILFYLLFALYVALLAVSVVRTYAHYRFECDPSVKSVCFLKNPNYNDQASVRAERNTTTVVYSTERYRTRQPYQNNKVAFLLTPKLLPHMSMDMAHVVLLVLFKISVLISAILLFTRIRQIAVVAEQLDIVETAATTIQQSMRMEWGTLPHPIVVHRHILHSLSDWRHRVIPLALVFLPLFITEGLLVVLCLPQVIIYITQRRGIFHYAQGIIYCVFLVLLIVFEALCAARVDEGVGDNTNWHMSFIPLYLALAIVATGVAASNLICGGKPVTGSRWGVFV